MCIWRVVFSFNHLQYPVSHKQTDLSLAMFHTRLLMLSDTVIATHSLVGSPLWSELSVGVVGRCEIIEHTLNHTHITLRPRQHFFITVYLTPSPQTMHEI